MSNHRIDEEAFAEMLEGAQSPRSIEATRMRSLVAAIERARPAGPALNPAFASSLREALLDDVRVLEEAERAARVPLHVRAAIWMQAKNEAWRRSLRMVAATGMAVMILGGTSAAFASAHNALPGQWNYGLKRFSESARLSVAGGPLDRGYAKLDAARTRLNEVRGLSASGSKEPTLYVSTLGDMDAATVEGSELLVEASRAGDGIEPLRRLATFATAQRARLEAVVVDVPAGARPAARDSLATLVLLSDRVSQIIEGCPCPGNPLEISPAGSTGGLPCICEAPGQGRRPAAGNDEEPVSGDEPEPTPSPSGTGSPAPEDPATDLIPGTDADDAANDAVDQVNDVLDGLGLPTVTTSPLPLPSTRL